MHRQEIITLNKIDIDQFSRRGAIVKTHLEDKCFFGWGEDLEQLSDEHVAYFNQWDFFGEISKRYIPRFICEVSISELKNFLKNNQQKLKANLDQSLDIIYENDFKNFHPLLIKKELKKIVLKSRQYYKTHINPLNVIAQFLKLEEAFIYGSWDEAYGMLGVTPEILLSKNKNTYHTMALAGTREITKRSELLSDRKELEEHQLVIQDIKDKLKDYELNIGITDLIDYKNFSHLKTPIQFESYDDGNIIVKKMTPTAALGGYPTEVALSKLKNSLYHQEVNECFFGGAFNFSYKDLFLSLVSIRNVQWNLRETWIESGTGIVSESKLSDEMNEIKLKRKSIESLIFEVQQP